MRMLIHLRARTFRESLTEWLTEWLTGLVAGLVACTFLVGCEVPDFCVEDTCVVLHEGAAPWSDLDEYLPVMRAITAENYGSGVAREAFTVDLELFPASHTLMLETTVGEIQVECGALWERPVIQAIVLGETTTDGCLPHEFWQHRLPHALGLGWNDEHSTYWQEVDATLVRSAELSVGGTASDSKPLLQRLQRLQRWAPSDRSTFETPVPMGLLGSP